MAEAARSSSYPLPNNVDQEQQKEIKVPAGLMFASTCAEPTALSAALEAVIELSTHEDLPVVACLNSGGPAVAVRRSEARRHRSMCWELRSVQSSAVWGPQTEPSTCRRAMACRATSGRTKEAAVLPKRFTPDDVDPRRDQRRVGGHPPDAVWTLGGARICERIMSNGGKSVHYFRNS